MSKEKVLKCINEHPCGITCHDIARELGGNYNTIKKQVGSLRKHGEVGLYIVMTNETDPRGLSPLPRSQCIYLYHPCL